ncbi:MAG: SDR family NAD(P)-dependent oxidoreductase, partial [Desulfobacterales bacterium]|nr:SDR family NAD(P)-dependent oxidoreductase [Desulfobacterales bacterium]
MVPALTGAHCCSGIDALFSFPCKGEDARQKAGHQDFVIEIRRIWLFTIQQLTLFLVRNDSAPVFCMVLAICSFSYILSTRRAVREESKDGYELRFAVNYLATFLLTHLLLPLLRDSAPSRIVNVASAGQQSIDFDDVMLESGYDGLRAYGQSKLAMILFTFDLAAQLKDSGITANCLHPATLMPTNMVLET